MTTQLHPNLINSAAGKIDLNIKSIIKESWHKVRGLKATYWKAFFLVLISVVLFNILLIVPTMLLTWGGGEATYTSIFLSLEDSISITVSYLFYASLSYIAISHIAGRAINAKMIFIFCKYFKKLILPAVLIGVLSFTTFHLFTFVSPLFNNVGLFTESVLLVIDAIGLVMVLGILIPSLYFSMLVILDKKLNPWESIKIVTKIYAKNFFKLLGFGLFIALFTICSLLLSFGIGLIWVLPMLTNITAIFYRQVFGIEQTI